jgi:hypothetical protein
MIIIFNQYYYIKYILIEVNLIHKLMNVINVMQVFLSKFTYFLSSISQDKWEENHMLQSF